MAVLAAINKGSSRFHSARTDLMAIALVASKFSFTLRAQHVAGKDNPADAPSRGSVAIANVDFTFRFFTRWASVDTFVDCCAAASGYNVQAGCQLWFSAADPVQYHVQDLVHRAIWAAPPWKIAGQVIDAIVAAWRRSPSDTEATMVLPYDTSLGWYKFYFRRPRPIFRILHRYPAGSPLFFKAIQAEDRFPHERAAPVGLPVMIVRLGHRHRHD